MLRRMLYLAVLPAVVCTARCAPLTLAERGRSDYAVVIPADAIPAEEFAAEELILHLERMSGARLPLRKDDQPLPDRAVLLGPTRYLDELGIAPDWNALGKEGFALKTAENHLVIAGGRPRGTLYGVYALLEGHLDCRWFAPDTERIPRREKIELPQLDLREVPVFEYREPWMYAGYIYSVWWRKHFVPEYVARTRNSGRNLNTHVHPVSERHGGYFKMPHAGHNLSQLVPAKLYAADHPEYFAWHDTERRSTGDLELCLTHPDVVHTATETMRAWMRETPDADMFFIGQSDTSNYCLCPNCLAAYRKYSFAPGNPLGGLGWGGLAGRNLAFANRIAERLEDELPDMRIGIFSYGATRNPPVNIKAHRNIVVWYCPIERCACHPLDRGPINRGFYNWPDGIRRWQQVVGDMYLYDYRLGNALAPPADLLTLGHTVRMARRLGFSGVKVDSIIDIQAGFGFCRYWLWMQLLRNPDIDESWALREFLDAYYGAAASHIDQFIRLASNPRMYEPLPEQKANIWTKPDSPMRSQLVLGCHLGQRKLTRAAIEQAYGLFDAAREATRSDPKCARHVEIARMVLQYAMLENLPADDPRLEQEAGALVQLAEELEMPTIQGTRRNEYLQRVRSRIAEHNE